MGTDEVCRIGWTSHSGELHPRFQPTIALWDPLDASPLSLEPLVLTRCRDIKGKVLGVPVWQLLGGKVRDRCDVYGWVGASLFFLTWTYHLPRDAALTAGPGTD